MIESDIRSNINADCETPMCHAMECEMHPDCTCDDCCKLTDSICEDNDQCEETHQTSGGKMKNKLMPILANSVVLLVVITLSVLNVSARNIDRPLELSTVPTIEILDDEVINHADISGEVDVVDIDEPIIAVNYVRDGVVLDYIPALDDLAIARTINV